ncbi:COG4315 family predicted lipoprotein [Streptomyces justiciae]|uniref:COG4315 family predicted lipoprotein n=1 Tax=Streptomyces justiciae TaxID=2780140 RepID=UPI0018823F4E|nr:hypothetical protein [Streptomyces justiciae]MBE8470655.1 hypothetical protein [Streptomyces justiciae]
MKRNRITLTGIALVAALGLAGCGGGGGSYGGGSDGGGGSDTPAAADTSTVKVSDSRLGDILVDGGGRTLYLFTADGKNTNSMKCDTACLKLWPPLEGKPKAGSGADAGLIGTTKGSAPQATYAGHPLYYYAKDKAPGDLKGQGIDGIWYVLNAKGTAMKQAAPSTDSDGDSGYGY